MNIINNIENSFYPEIYSQILPRSDNLSLSLFKKDGLARYVLAVKNFDSNLDIKTQIANARKSIRQQTSAMWLFKEVGAYIVFVCDEVPDLTKSQLEIDRFGFHAVIVQGVHLVSKSGAHLFNHSKWLNKSFGGTESIASMLVNSAI
ncbi:hypothetical protein [Colwellia psychrerythraea]|uniref:Uncharacterized protein n=1 Tax=Colwellia psychrerythraea (strain 34H / ATCC BAA-681) TaxID=167879 RepID=Q480Q7_COLP3|nr:hypothetical protein [Colwellia psychrerythraea]AAZ26230.1 hypothetical protein CPS_2750 [Colwellia psychrerythraea 34H]